MPKIAGLVTADRLAHSEKKDPLPKSCGKGNDRPIEISYSGR